MTERRRWDELQAQRLAGLIPQPAEPSRIEALCARLLTAGDGKELLDWLRSETVEKRNRPGAPEAELRELEAQRALVSRLERLRDIGREAAGKRS